MKGSAYSMANSADTNSLLDNPVWHALTNQHSLIALGDEWARRYPPDVAPFGAVAAHDQRSFASLVDLIPSGEVVALLGEPPMHMEPWVRRWQATVVQMVYDGTALEAVDQRVAISPLSSADVPAMLQLVEDTHPGPFLPRTIELGRYLSVRQEGQLAAMAGERFHLPGYREISAVCTHPSFQRRGYAKQLMLQLMHEIQAEGEVPMLHVVSGNDGALALYEALGFKRRSELALHVLQLR
jgi:ribosomal protein S18 acetylase RimI-like enzyme